MAVFALIVLGLVFAPFYYKNKVATLPEFLGKRYISPPISAVFFWGVFWRRGNHQGAIATFAGGFLLGLTAFLVDFPIFGDTKIISDGWGISFMMQAWWLFVASSVIFIGTSLISPPPDYEKIESVTLRSPLAFLNREEGEDRNIPLIISGVLAGIMILLYLIF